jgi:hypothetical protein
MTSFLLYVLLSWFAGMYDDFALCASMPKGIGQDPSCMYGGHGGDKVAK